MGHGASSGKTPIGPGEGFPTEAPQPYQERDSHGVMASGAGGRGPPIQCGVWGECPTNIPLIGRGGVKSLGGTHGRAL